jgi:hypothetical protein
MMQELSVILREATDDGRLIYQHDLEVADYLIYARSPRFTQAVYRVELEDPVLFRLNANRILEAVKIVIPRHAWRIAPAQAMPTANISANLEFSSATIQQHSFDLSLRRRDYRCSLYLCVDYLWASGEFHFLGRSLRPLLGLARGRSAQGFFYHAALICYHQRVTSAGRGVRARLRRER